MVISVIVIIIITVIILITIIIILILIIQPHKTLVYLRSVLCQRHYFTCIIQLHLQNYPLEFLCILRLKFRLSFNWWSKSDAYMR